MHPSFAPIPSPGQGRPGARNDSNRRKTDGVQDIPITVVDKLKGFPQTIEAVFRQTRVQTGIVQVLRHSVNFASYQDRKAVANVLKAVYSAVDAKASDLALAELDCKRRTIRRSTS